MGAIALAAILTVALTAGCSGTAQITGRIISIANHELTLELGTVVQSGQAEPSTDASGDGQAPQRSGESAADSSIQPQENAGNPSPEAAEQQQETSDGISTDSGFTTTGETQIIAIKDGVEIVQQYNGEQVRKSIEDLSVGDVVTITLSGGTASTVEIASLDAAEICPQNAVQNAAYVVDQTEQSIFSRELAAVAADQSVVLVQNDGQINLIGVALQKSGDTTNQEESNLYGRNAALVVQQGGAEIERVTIETDGESAGAVFAVGSESGVSLDDATICTQQDASQGLYATFGATIDAQRVEIATHGAYSAAVATGPGEGTITVTEGDLHTSGQASPCIYSAGTVTANAVTGMADKGQCAVVEEMGGVVLQNCALTGENGVVLYRRDSTQTAQGTATFTALQSTLCATSDAPMFEVANARTQVTLQGATLSFPGGILARVSGDGDGGTPAQNGGQLVLNAVSQVLAGDLLVDESSALQLNLKDGSTLVGAVNAAHTGKEVHVNLDETAQWQLTDTSYLTVLTNARTDCSNIQSNGHNIYYDAANASNAWLNGNTLTLPGGGLLTPIA